MAVLAVHLQSDAFLVALNHALSTEKEEVMGLCLGEVEVGKIVHIHSVIVLRRSDKRKDRVEISPEQLSAASLEAERLTELTGRPMRVVGWYHSHPHITVWPSHVDIRTQAMYQMMDESFVGLIFSCFIEDKNTKTGRVLYTCFQSVQAQKGSEYERVDVPLHVLPQDTMGKASLEAAIELPKILCQEEQDAYRKIHSLTHLDAVTKIHNGSGSGETLQACEQGRVPREDAFGDCGEEESDPGVREAPQTASLSLPFFFVSLSLPFLCPCSSPMSLGSNTPSCVWPLKVSLPACAPAAPWPAHCFPDTDSIAPRPLALAEGLVGPKPHGLRFVWTSVWVWMGTCGWMGKLEGWRVGDIWGGVE
ncbi:lys-63-specific deubiquitinase BRCC36 isoform X1 [Sarcophilus harrisii]|uniref:lys-63-specific deubiquitinase BRCC36 isoform X1 n=1 Tax=Sarcophilus harrisii TaxID=9305 RepID=UPI001301DCE4|nr:lys-63-specific deubiquitinase BRCC36 isoform X1 [Sarcophilus harrisii]